MMHVHIEHVAIHAIECEYVYCGLLHLNQLYLRRLSLRCVCALHTALNKAAKNENLRFFFSLANIIAPTPLLLPLRKHSAHLCRECTEHQNMNYIYIVRVQQPDRMYEIHFFTYESYFIYTDERKKTVCSLRLFHLFLRPSPTRGNANKCARKEEQKKNDVHKNLCTALCS